MQKPTKHKGVFIGCWISPEQAQKIETLSIASGKSKTQILKALIDKAPIIDKSYWKTYSQLASIGGLIKGMVESGKHGNAYKLGQEILKIARELERIEKERQICAPQS